MKNEANSILLVVSSLLPGGAERATLGLADYLASEGFDVHLFVARRDPNYEGTYQVPDNVTAHYIKHGFNSKLLRPLLNTVLLRRLIDEYAFEWVISLGAQYKTLSLARCFDNAKVLLSERNCPEKFYAPSEKDFVEGCYQRATRVVFQTEEAMNYFSAVPAERKMVIPNAVREGLPQWIGSGNKTIAFVGRLSDQKNPSLLINAFRLFHDGHPDWTLEMYGDGYLRSAISQQVEDEGLGDSVHLHGNVSRVENYVSSAGMYVSSSDYEGISNSMLEALAMGVPTVCTDCAGGGARLAIQNGVNGLLTQCNDVEGLARAMVRIADNAELARKMSAAAVESSERFAPSAIYAQWLVALS